MLFWFQKRTSLFYILQYYLHYKFSLSISSRYCMVKQGDRGVIEHIYFHTFSLQPPPNKKQKRNKQALYCLYLLSIYII